MSALETRHRVNIASSNHTFWLTDQLIPLTPFPLSHPLLQLHNEDDSSEASTSEPQPCTSATAQASTSSQDQSQAELGATAAEASGSGTQAEADAPPPPYASIDLGATAAPGMYWDYFPFCLHLIRPSNVLFLSSNFIFPKCGCMLPKIATAAVLRQLLDRLNS